MPDLPRIVAFRNILIHGYAVVDDELVWQVLVERLPGLAVVLRDLLDGGPGCDRTVVVRESRRRSR